MKKHEKSVFTHSAQSPQKADSKNLQSVGFLVPIVDPDKRVGKPTG
jgi:hypothetical protein